MTENAQDKKHLPLPRRRTVVTILLTLVVFVSGMFVGGAVTINVLWNRLVYNLHNPENIPARVAERTSQILGLDAEQETAVREIITRQHGKIAAIRQENYPRVNQILEELRSEVAAELTPDQADRWNSIFMELHSKLFPPPGDG
jgi:hypothetical protein